MNNGDVLRRLRYAFDFKDQTVIELFQAGGLEVTRSIISDLLKREEDPAHQPCSNVQLAAFLNGFIRKKRGTREGEDGPPALENELDNNVILRKLKIALKLKEDEMRALLELAGMPVGRAELSALFRKPGHPHYRACQDQLLRNFLQGIQLKYRDAGASSSIPPGRE